MRPFCPGVAFHISAHVNGGRPFFTETIRDRIAELVAEETRQRTAQLIAATILPNELNLVLIQGQETLSELMQPLLRRAALVTQRANDLSGHVFGGPFKSQVCSNARKAILWLHWLPVHAGASGSVHEYRWSSHHVYARSDAEPFAGVNTMVGLRIFGERGSRTATDPRHIYLRQIMRRVSPGEFPGFTAKRRVAMRAGDLMADSRTVLRTIDAECDIDTIREPVLRGRALMQIRREVIAKLRVRGYSGCELAEYFGVSQSLISRCRW